MPLRILHLLDATTPPDAMQVLAQLLRHGEGDHRLAALSHHSTAALARDAGIIQPIQFLHSMGWADPTGWRAVRRLVKTHAPTHLHAWGIPSAIAATMARFSGQRVVTLADLPSPMHLRLLPMIHKGTLTGLWGSPSPCHWTATTSWLKRELHAHSIAADAVTLIRLPLSTEPPLDSAALALLREDLGLLPEDGPVLLLGGDGGAGTVLASAGIDPVSQGGRGGPRHDLGLWAAAILEQIFPRIRVIVRADPRGRPDPGLDRLMNHLPDDNIVIPAAADYSWRDLLALADAFVITPDGPMPSGCILEAIAAGVVVIGTPVDSVREYFNGHANGNSAALFAPSIHPRQIAATIESFLSHPDRREAITSRARQEALARHDPASALRAYQSVYAAAPDYSCTSVPRVTPS